MNAPTRILVANRIDQPESLSNAPRAIVSMLDTQSLAYSLAVSNPTIHMISNAMSRVAWHLEWIGLLRAQSLCDSGDAQQHPINNTSISLVLIDTNRIDVVD